MDLPIAFVDKMRTLLGDDLENYLGCFNERPFSGLRVNTNKISVTEFLKIAPWDLEPIPWIDNGFYYYESEDIVRSSKHPYYYAGLYYLQEPSAMTPANILPIEAGDKVLDLCAAPGGKATELGAKLANVSHGKNEGLLVANDISNSRAKGLLKNIELMGIGNVLVVSEDSAKLVDYFEGYFDKVLIDAPCSGEGMFRKDTKMIKSWEEQGPENYYEVGRDLIINGGKMLKPGGLLLYSTCTFDSGENEQVIEYLLDKHPEFKIVDLRSYEGFSEGMPGVTHSNNKELEKTIRLYPHRIKGEGHYIALLKKEEHDKTVECGKAVVNCEAPERGENLKSVDIPKELVDFLSKTDRKFDFNRFMIKNEQVYYLPKNLPNLSGLRFLRTGLFLGNIKKNRFEPSQALAMSLKKVEYELTIDFDVKDDRVIRYLKGETLDDLSGVDIKDGTDNKSMKKESDKKSGKINDKISDKIGDKKSNKISNKERDKKRDSEWYLVCVSGFPLGFGKIVVGKLKNKYSPGWRIISKCKNVLTMQEYT